MKETNWVVTFFNSSERNSFWYDSKAGGGETETNPVFIAAGIVTRRAVQLFTYLGFCRL